MEQEHTKVPRSDDFPDFYRHFMPFLIRHLRVFRCTSHKERGDDDDDDDDGCVVSDRNGYCGRGRSGNKNGTASEESGRRRKVTMEDTIQKW